MARLEDAPAGDAARPDGFGVRWFRRARGRKGSGSGAASPGPASPPVSAGAPERAPRGRRLSVYVLVLALSVALVAPAAGFLAYVIDEQGRALQRQVEARGTQLASEIADRLEQEFESMGTMLAVFASSGWLEADELELLHRRASRALAGTERHLIVLDESFEQLLNTRVPFGTSLGKTANTQAAEDVLETGRPAVSNIFMGRVAEARVFNTLRPVVLPDGRERVMILTRNVDTLGALVGTAARNAAWNVAALDGSGDVVTGYAADQDAELQVPVACRREAPGPQAQPAGKIVPHVYLRLLEGTSWRVCVWPASGAPAVGAGFWTRLLTAAAAWIVLAVVTAVSLSTLISRSIARTARIGAQLGSGRDVAYVPSFIQEVDDVRRALADAGAERVRNDRRLELLVREAAHRARNQIALAVSLVDLSARGADTADGLRDDIKGRLNAIGRSVDALTDQRPDVARLRDLVTGQLAPFLDDGGERLVTQGDEVLISERAAQSLSLVLHELATNASKYGAWTLPDGTVTVNWHLTDDELVIDWSEDGPPSEEPDRQGFGTTLLETLVTRSLSGTIDRRFGAGGFGCRMALPRQKIVPSDGV